MSYRIYFNRETGKKVQTITAATAVPSMQDVICFQELYGEFAFFVMSRDEFFAKFTREFEKIPAMERKALEQRPEIEQKVKRLEEKEMPVQEPAKEEEESVLFQILDAQTAEEKIRILLEKKSELDDNMLDNIAVCFDIVWEDDENKFEHLLQYFELQKKYETGRLR